jgi:hypothetical protein
MQATDAAGTRLQQGMALARRALTEVEARDVQERPLGEPARLPPARSLDPSREHWLVTDGADAAVNAWAASVPVGRVLQVPGPNRNMGVTRLSARLQPGDPSALALQVRVLNGGSTRESRRLELLAGSSRVETRTVDLDAGLAATLEFALRLPSATTAGVRLLPSDALSADDALQLDLGSLARVPVTVDPSCPSAVARAVGAHPALEVVTADPARLVVDCGSLPASPGAGRIVLHRGERRALDASRALWSPASADLQQRLAGHVPDTARGGLEPLGAGDVQLLASGTTPLIVRRATVPRVVKSALDVDAPGFAAGAGLPLLVAALADVALDETLLGRTASVGRGDESSRVAPLAMTGAPALNTAAPVLEPLALLPMLALAMVLLAWDTAVLLLRIARGRRLLRASAA